MKYIVANWKMNMDLNDLGKWISGFKEEARKLDLENYNKEVTVVAVPSHIHILNTYLELKDTGIQIASQNVSEYEKGAHTGEVGAFQLAGFCKYSIVGHSERKENKDTVLKKAELCFENGITPIICFTNPELAPVFYKQGGILAWEDPSNISVEGQYKNKETSEIAEGFNKIRKYVSSDKIVIYGGSVNTENVVELAKVEGLDGVLVGNASLDPKTFAQIIKAFCI